MTAVMFVDTLSRSLAAEVLSYPVISYMIDSCPQDSVVFCPDALAGKDSRASAFSTAEQGIPANVDKVLLFCAAAPLLSKTTVEAFVNNTEISSELCRGKQQIALCFRADKLPEVIKTMTAETKAEVPDGEWLCVENAESLYFVQEQLRRKINMGWMKKGVYLVDPNTTHISPFASIGDGSVILPGCLIYGNTQIGENCKIGPNAMLESAIVGDGSSVNSSQVKDSKIGKNTTVGPFAYIRPGCHVGDDVRIGDFVELKNSNIGNGTKVSHLTYLGDSDFGEKINVGCGVVTVNYDGKNKYRTKVGDGSFIGCNVNLVAPVEVEKGAYLAAGSTITEKVPEGSLAIARERQTVKENWTNRRRQDGKLK